MNTKTYFIKETGTPICYQRWNGRNYAALITPKADSKALSELGDRLIFHHGSPTMPESEMVIAQRGIITSGWVLGVFEQASPQDWDDGHICGDRSEPD